MYVATWAANMTQVAARQRRRSRAKSTVAPPGLEEEDSLTMMYHLPKILRIVHTVQYCAAQLEVPEEADDRPGDRVELRRRLRQEVVQLDPQGEAAGALPPGQGEEERRVRPLSQGHDGGALQEERAHRVRRLHAQAQQGAEADQQGAGWRTGAPPPPPSPTPNRGRAWATGRSRFPRASTYIFF